MFPTVPGYSQKIDVTQFNQFLQLFSDSLDTNVWYTSGTASVSGGYLNIANGGQAYTWQRFVFVRFEASAIWGATPQVGAEESLGLGYGRGTQFVGFRIYGTEFAAVCRAHNAETKVVLAFPGTGATAPHSYEIVIHPEQVEFYIDYALVATIATNITDVAQSAWSYNGDAFASTLKINSILINQIPVVIMHPITGKARNRIFAIDSSVADSKSNSDTAAGNVDLTSSAVPAGKIWIITNLQAYNAVSVITRIILYAPFVAPFPWVKALNSPAVSQGIDCQGWIVLNAGQTMVARFIGCFLHDQIYFSYMGFQMDA